MSAMGSLLSVRNISKSFVRGTMVLRDLSLEVAGDDRLVIIGPSGGGKSTLIRCIMGLEEIDGGQIDFIGNPYVYVDKNNSRTRIDKKSQLKIGMVFQNYTLFPHLSVLQNLVLASVKVRKESRGDAKEKATELLRRFNLLDKESEYPNKLSGGQKQRVAIARALMLEPKLMLFDEITSALDPELVAEVLDVMHQLARQDMAMVIITHEMEFARKIATEVALIDEGQIIERDVPEIIFDNANHTRTREFLSHFAR